MALNWKHLSRFVTIAAMVWALGGPSFLASPFVGADDRPPALQELVQAQSAVIVGESQLLLKGAVALGTFSVYLIDLPGQALSTARELTIAVGERNPFYLLPTIHAP